MSVFMWKFGLAWDSDEGQPCVDIEDLHIDMWWGSLTDSTLKVSFFTCGYRDTYALSDPVLFAHCIYKFTE